MNDRLQPTVVRFGAFELDLDAERLLENGRVVRLQPQPFKLLRLLASQPGRLVTREAIQATLWTNDTFVDFEQGVNFAIKQLRDALGDRAEHPLYVQTVPKRGYRFVAPVSAGTELDETGERHLQKVLWENIADLRLADDRRRRQLAAIVVALVCVAVLLVLLLLGGIGR
jgi:DNA-binding winged helix-turn-helix (wHTH) protein